MHQAVIDAFPDSSVDFRDEVCFLKAVKQQIVILITTYPEKSFDVDSVKLFRKFLSNFY
jgi:hypothetical protein